MTPAQIGAEIGAALELADGASRQLLRRALDALSDGLPADDVETLLRLALRSLDADSSS